VVDVRGHAGRLPAPARPGDDAERQRARGGRVLPRRDGQPGLAVERTTPSALGTPVERYGNSQPTSQITVDVTDVGDADLVYRLASPVPSNWIPYLPTRTPAGDDITLTRLAGSLPRGEIAAEPTAVEDEEVSRAGIVVERAWQYARWSGGQPLLWLARRVRPGRGEGSSGLAWDQTEPPPSTAAERVS
jgi:hypothetical protein